MIQSVDPTTGKVMKVFSELTPKELEKKVILADLAQKKWKKTAFEERAKILHKVADVLRVKKDELGATMTKEMGKTLTSAVFEVVKCAGICDYFADHAEGFLRDEKIVTEAVDSHVSFEPLGIILSIMPWNYPFSQVFRCSVPAIMAGNGMLIKHASNVPQSSMVIESVFLKAGLPKGVFQNLLISSKDALALIGNEYIKGVTFTGSEKAGCAIAAEAGKHLKKVVLEMGGSDPFIVLDDADLKEAVAIGVKSRLLVSGQTCISAKRFIISKKIASQFLALFKKAMESQVIGDPMHLDTTVGPLSSEQVVKNIEKQVTVSVKMGAKLVTGGKKLDRPGYFYAPTIMTDVTEQMPVFKEETFGPVAAVIVVSDDEEALKVANNTRFGLGATVFTQSKARAAYFTKHLEAGNVYVNSMVRSDPRVPFGGVKASGFGRELSSYGIKEFTNIKTVWMEKI